MTPHAGAAAPAPRPLLQLAGKEGQDWEREQRRARPRTRAHTHAHPRLPQSRSVSHQEKLHKEKTRAPRQQGNTRRLRGCFIEYVAPADPHGKPPSPVAPTEGTEPRTGKRLARAHGRAPVPTHARDTQLGGSAYSARAVLSQALSGSAGPRAPRETALPAPRPMSPGGARPAVGPANAGAQPLSQAPLLRLQQMGTRLGTFPAPGAERHAAGGQTAGAGLSARATAPPAGASERLLGRQSPGRSARGWAALCHYHLRPAAGRHLLTPQAGLQEGGPSPVF